MNSDYPVQPMTMDTRLLLASVDNDAMEDKAENVSTFDCHTASFFARDSFQELHSFSHVYHIVCYSHDCFL